MSFKRQVRQLQERLDDVARERKCLTETELFVLDNSLRESTVGQLRGHTMENKWQIYEEVKKVGFKHIVVAAFTHMTRLGDTFIKQLKEKGEDFEMFYAFSELIESIDKNRVPDTETIPVGLRKCADLGIRHCIIEFDLEYQGIDYDVFTDDIMLNLMSERITWVKEHMNPNARIFFNFRDFSVCMNRHPERVLKVVNYLSSLPFGQRPFGLMYEETGKFLPEELGAWTKAVRQEMNECGFRDGHLLAHVHEQWGLQDATQLECIANGADGIWASLCIEGAAMGHAASTVSIMNLIRMGNQAVLNQYNCSKLREAAINVTLITTGKPPAPKQVIYGERALDMVFGMPNFQPEKQSFNLAEFFGEEPLVRVTPLASDSMIVSRLVQVFGSDPDFTEERASRMREVMLEDMHQNRKEDYMSEVGLALLYERSGGSLTGKMAEAVEKAKVTEPHHAILMKEVRDMWDEWDLRDGVKDDMLDFDAFYNGFLAPYFGCYRCDETKTALNALDMDKDGMVDWNEFELYLKWALYQYPEINTAEDTLKTAFQKGLIPVMQEELQKTFAS